MANNLAVKEVNFEGDTLYAAQDKNTDKVYVGIRWVCKGLGLTEKQKDRQVANIKTDIVLKRGSLKFEGGVFDPNNETWAIELDFLPLWLAKISITPKMKKENPFLVQKLVDYQLKAKDVLAAAFIKKGHTVGTLQFMQLVLDQMKEQQAQADAMNDKVTHIQHYLTETPDRKKIQRELRVYARRKNITYSEAITHIYKTLEDKHDIDIKQRVRNKWKQINADRSAEGKKPYADSTLKQRYNGMDVIIDLGYTREVMEILAGLA